MKTLSMNGVAADVSRRTLIHVEDQRRLTSAATLQQHASRAVGSWILSRFAVFSLTLSLTAATPALPHFRTVDIDTKVEIGYGLAIADVDGDGKSDILLADKKTVQWYHNPDWAKHVIAENLTEQDNVCIAAADLDGDGKCEVAVGAGWQPSDTLNSGAVFYLIAPKDRTQKWTPVALHHEPSVHRMHWVLN